MSLSSFLSELILEATRRFSPCRFHRKRQYATLQSGFLCEITNNYQPPADACTTYRALYHALAGLEQDLHQHLHLENNILFPRALAVAKE